MSSCYRSAGQTWQNRNFWCILLLSAVVEACGSLPEDPGATGSTNTGSPPGTVPQILSREPVLVANSDALLTFFPSGLALASPFLASDRLNQQNPFIQRRTEMSKRLRATKPDHCAYDFAALPMPTRPACFGPEIRLRGHPDFADGTTLPADFVGIWTASDPDGNACLAARTNFDLETTIAELHRALNGIAMLLCLANIHDVPVPELESTVNFTAIARQVLPTALSSRLLDAKLSRGDDSNLNRPVVTTTLVYDLDRSSHMIAKLRQQAIHPENGTLQGSLWGWVSHRHTDPLQTEIFSLAFERLPDGDYLTDLRAGLIDTDDAIDYFGNDKQIRLDKTVNHGLTIRARINSERGMVQTGVFRPGPADSMQHGYILSIDDDPESGQRSFCGIHGHRQTTNPSDAEPWLSGTLCDPLLLAEPADLLQRQCAVENSQEQRYLPTSSNVTFVPRASCGSRTEDNSAWQWQMSSESDADQWLSFPNQNNLVPLKDVPLALRSPPPSPQILGASNPADAKN